VIARNVGADNQGSSSRRRDARQRGRAERAQRGSRHGDHHASTSSVSGTAAPGAWSACSGRRRPARARSRLPDRTTGRLGAWTVATSGAPARLPRPHHRDRYLGAVGRRDARRPSLPLPSPPHASTARHRSARDDDRQGARKKLKRKSATVTFSADEAESTFTCKLDVSRRSLQLTAEAEAAEEGPPQVQGVRDRRGGNATRPRRQPASSQAKRR